MSEQFSVNLEGSVLFKKIIAFLLAYVICMISAMYLAYDYSMIGYLGSLLLAIISGIFLEFKVMEYLINSVSLNSKSFTFTGNFSAFIGVVVKGSVLSFITLGIYSPWFLRNIVSFFADNTEYPERGISFESSGGKLLKYIFLGFIIPLILFVIVLVLGFSLDSAVVNEDMSAMVSFFILYMVGVIVLSSLLLFFMYKWYINFIFGNEKVTFSASLGETVVFFVIQYFLTFITMGIYGFAFQIKLIKYLAEKTEFTDISTGRQRLVYFSGGIGEGFLLFLGQGVLSILTLGIYSPWAIAKINNWVINHLEITDNPLI